MKKKLIRAVTFTFVLLLVFPMILTSCNDGTGEEDDKFSFVYNDVKIIPGDDMAPILATLGEPTKYYEAASCAFNGLDKMYTWGSVQINTYPDGDKDRVLSIILLDDANLTPEGVTIGSGREAVIAAYGNNYEGGETALTYSKGGTELKFLMRDGCVTSVQYYDSEAQNTDS